MGFIRTAISTPLELSDGTESLLHTQPHVRVFLSATHTLGPGTLHITTKRVLWLPDNAQPADSGYSIDFPQLLMHALSRDTAFFPHPAIYCQLEQDDEDDGEEEEGEDEEGGEEDRTAAAGVSEAEGGGDEMTAAAEVRVVPDDEAARQSTSHTCKQNATQRNTAHAVNLSHFARTYCVSYQWTYCTPN